MNIFMMKYMLATALLFVSASSFAACEDNVAYGIPESTAKTTLLCRKAYTVEYYNSCKTPLFVAQYLDPKQIGGNEPRLSFRADKDLPPELRANNSDYAGTGYDKGHMAPAADFHSDSVTMEESFLLSNAVPQTPRLNRGVWKSIEIRTRALSDKLGGVYVITGGVFSAHPSTIGEGVCVPDYTYKVIFAPKINQSIGYIVPNVAKGLQKNIKAYQVPVSSIEAKTGLNFTPALKDGPFVKQKVGENMTTAE